MKKYITWRMAWFIYLLICLGFITYLVWFEPKPDSAYTTSSLNDNWSLELKVSVNPENAIIATTALKNISDVTLDAGGGMSNKCFFGPHIKANFVEDKVGACPFNIEPIDVKPGESIVAERTFERPAEGTEERPNIISVDSNGLTTTFKFK